MWNVQRPSVPAIVLRLVCIATLTAVWGCGASTFQLPPEGILNSILTKQAAWSKESPSPGPPTAPTPDPAGGRTIVWDPTLPPPNATPTPMPGMAKHYLISEISHPAGGTITRTPEKSDNIYDSGTSVKMEISTNDGYAFDHWEGDLTSIENPLTVTMDSCKVLRAVMRYVGPHGTGTEVSGGIYENTTWAASGSPYIVKDNITIFPGLTLSIEPGVDVIFEKGTAIIPRGKILIKGTCLEKINFKLREGVTDGLGYICGGLDVVNATFEHVLITGFIPPTPGLHAFYAKNCRFSGGGVNCGSCVLIDCTFDNSSTAAGWGGVYRSLFRNNQCAIKSSIMYAMCASGCTLEYNETAIDGTSDCAGVFFCTISNNVRGVYGPAEIFSSSIINNTTGLVGTIEMSGCNIYGSTEYNFTFWFRDPPPLYPSYSWDAPNNYWGTTDTNEIDAKICDGLDNASLGLVTYQPIATTPFDISCCYLEAEVLGPSICTVGTGMDSNFIYAFAPGATTPVTVWTPDGWTFSHWELDASGTDTRFTMTMNANKRVRAVYFPK